MNEIEDKNYVKTINALQRVYFTILKDKMKESYVHVMKGVTKYIRIIRKEFHEGLYVLLTDAMKECDIESKKEGMLCVLKVYINNGMDFKSVLDNHYDIINPLNFDLEEKHFNYLSDNIIQILFVKNKQSISRVTAVSQKLILARCFRPIPQYLSLIKQLEITYDIDYNENDIRNKKVSNIFQKDIDKVESKPFYEYSLFKKVL